MLLALALAELIAIDVLAATDIRLLGSEALQALALGLLLVGVVSDIDRNFLDQRARLFDTTIAMRAVQTQARLGTAMSGRRRHEVANALMGLEGAASTLERFYDRLDGDDRKRLAEMVGQSVDRLRNLSTDDPAKPQAFPLTDATGPLLTRFSEAGLVAESTVPGDIAVRALPAEVGEVLEQVAKAVLDESPQGPVRLSAVRFGETAWLSVEFKPASSSDGGSANVGRLRRRMTPRGNQALGRGMDLSVAAHMVRERGGQLLAEPVGEGEVAIRLQLPAAT
jgi:signal transduction histidine kinase